MSLSTRDRQQIYTRLAPVIGEQEAETLLDQFPSTADTELATVADVNLVRADVDLVRAELATVEARLGGEIHKAITQTMWMIATPVTVLGLIAWTNVFG